MSSENTNTHQLTRPGPPVGIPARTSSARPLSIASTGSVTEELAIPFSELSLEASDTLRMQQPSDDESQMSGIEMSVDATSKTSGVEIVEDDEMGSDNGDHQPPSHECVMSAIELAQGPPPGASLMDLDTDNNGHVLPMPALQHTLRSSSHAFQYEPRTPREITFQAPRGNGMQSSNHAPQNADRTRSERVAGRQRSLEQQIATREAARRAGEPPSGGFIARQRSRSPVRMVADSKKSTTTEDITMKEALENRADSVVGFPSTMAALTTKLNQSSGHVPALHSGTTLFPPAVSSSTSQHSLSIGELKADASPVPAGMLPSNVSKLSHVMNVKPVSGERALLNPPASIVPSNAPPLNFSMDIKPVSGTQAPFIPAAVETASTPLSPRIPPGASTQRSESILPTSSAVGEAEICRTKAEEKDARRAAKLKLSLKSQELWSQKYQRPASSSQASASGGGNTTQREKFGAEFSVTTPVRSTTPTPRGKENRGAGTASAHHDDAVGEVPDAFKAWPKQGERVAPAAGVRRVRLSNLPSTSTTAEVLRVVWGGKLEAMYYKPGNSWAEVLFTRPEECKAYLNATANGVEWPGQDRPIWVEAHGEVEPVSSVLAAQLYNTGATRCIRVIGADKKWALSDFEKLAASDNRKLEKVLDAHMFTGDRVIVFRFTNIKDAVTFKGKLAKDENFEQCNILYAVDPCDEAKRVHN